MGRTNVNLRIPAALWARLQWARLHHGLTIIRCVERALPGWLTVLESEPYSGLGFEKSAGDPYPPRPPGATNRRGGQPPLEGEVHISSVQLASPLAARLLGAAYWRQESHSRMVQDALTAWLDALEKQADARPGQMHGEGPRA